MEVLRGSAPREIMDLARHMSPLDKVMACILSLDIFDAKADLFLVAVFCENSDTFFKEESQYLVQFRERPLGKFIEQVLRYLLNPPADQLRQGHIIACCALGRAADVIHAAYA